MNYNKLEKMCGGIPENTERKERGISLLLSKPYLDVLRLKYPKIVVDFYI